MNPDFISLAFIVGMAIVLPLVAWGLLRFGRERAAEVTWDSPASEVPGPEFRPGAVELNNRASLSDQLAAGLAGYRLALSAD